MRSTFQLDVMPCYLLICIFVTLPLNCITFRFFAPTHRPVHRPAMETHNARTHTPKHEITSTIVVIGPRGSGKSTTAGYLRFATTPDNMFYRNPYVNEKNYKPASNLEYLEMRERMDHIDGDIGIFEFYKGISSKDVARITMIDYPFHGDYVKNVLAFYSQADCALLVVSAQEDEFKEDSLNLEQTQSQLFMIRAMGIQNLIVVVNKMDATEPKYSQARFHEVANLVKTLINKVGLVPERVPIIPISAAYDENVLDARHNTRFMDWWTMQTITSPTRIDKLKFKSLLDAIGSINTNGKRTTYNDLKALRLPILKVYNRGGEGTTAIGRIQNGFISNGTTVTCTPSGLTSKLKHLEVGSLQSDNNNDRVDVAGGGDLAQLQFPWNVSVDAINTGDVCYNVNEDPAMETESFIARINIIDHPSQIEAGYTPMMHIHTAAVACRFDKLISKTNMRTRKTEKNPKFLKSGDIAVVKMIPDPVYVSPIRVYHRLSGFVIRDEDKTVAVGGIMSTVPKN